MSWTSIIMALVVSVGIPVATAIFKRVQKRRRDKRLRRAWGEER